LIILKVLGSSERFLMVLGGLGKVQDVLERPRLFWKVLGVSWMFLDVVGGLQKFSKVL
jgi:hypothetical protein